MFKIIARSSFIRSSASATRRQFSLGRQNIHFRAAKNPAIGVGLVFPLAFAAGYFDNSVRNEEEEVVVQEESSDTGPVVVEVFESTTSDDSGDNSPVVEEVDIEETVAIDGDADNSSEGAAFNPETGEINWDCPCLGGMAHGPCGEEFKEAFACFVYSEAEPKGIDCIKKFENMRTCFKQHPEHYKEELYDDDEPVASDSPASSEMADAEQVNDPTPIENKPVEAKTESKSESKPKNKL